MAIVAVAGVLVIFAFPPSRTFNGFEWHGGPIVTNTGHDATVVVLTSHWETQQIRTSRNATTANNYADLHWDVFALNANDLSRRWTTRLATIRRGQRDMQAALLGVSHNTVWVLADGLMAVSLRDGKVLGDADAIVALNPQLRGMMPTARRQMYFDNGLTLITADGNRWRIDSESLQATADTVSVAIKTSIMGVPVPRATDSLHVLPVTLSSQYHSFKSRSYVVGDTWYGMMHPSEVELQRRDPHTQNFNVGMRYRLWQSPLRDTLDRMRNRARLPLDFAPVASSPEFLNGGLLTVPDAQGRNRVVGIADPTRFLVLHEDRIDDAANQTLTCIQLDGRVCWDAPLGMRTATSFSTLTRGGPEDWAFIITGVARPQAGDQMVDQAGDNLPLVARVRVGDGRTLRFRFADIDFKAMDAALTPYRSRRQ
jgi:hypothetical protein